MILLSAQNLTSQYSRFEEVHDDEEESAKKDSKKRPRESDSMETDEPKLSKAEKKKQNKKLKAEDGKAVAAGAEESPAKADKKDKKEKKEKKKAEKAEKPAAKVIEKEGGLKIQEHKVGSGPQAKKGDKISVRYIGKLTNGKEFDKNTGGKPVSCVLSAMITMVS